MTRKFIIKLILNGIIVVPLLMFYTEASFGAALFTAVALCAIAFLLGDQIILRASNNTIATLADAVLSFVFLWSVASAANWSLSLGELMTIVVLLGIVEAFFHRMLNGDFKYSR